MHKQQQQGKSSYLTHLSNMADRFYLFKNETCLCNLGVDKYFLVQKFYQETGGICWHTKNGMIQDIGG
jgi:hypothetical protein